MSSVRVLVLMVLAAGLWPAEVLGAEEQEDTGARETMVERWLVAGPVEVALPAFHDVEDGRFEPKDLLLMDGLDLGRLAPGPGDRLSGPGGADLEWAEAEAVALPAPAGPAIAWCFTRVRNERFTHARLVVKSTGLLRVVVDGQQVAKKETVDTGEASADLKLEPGDHRVLVQVVATAGGDWRFEALLRQNGDWRAADLAVHTGKAHRLGVDDLLDTEAVSWVRVSADGRWLALGMRRPEVPGDDAESWVEIRDTQSGRLEFTTAGIADLSGFQWLPSALEYSFVTRAKDLATVWRSCFPGGRPRPVLEGVADFGSYRWTPDGASIIYSVTTKAKKDERGAKRMRGLADRFPDYRDRSHLYQACAERGVRQRLTAGPLGVELQDIHPDSSRLLFTRKRYGLTERPFARDELFELDLETLRATKICESAAFDGASYSPDGARFLIRGGLSFLLERSEFRPDGYIPNDYDKRLFILDRSGKIDHLTAELDRNVEEAVWSRADGMIYLRAEDGSRVRLFRLNPDDRTFESLVEDMDAVSGMTVAAAGRTLAYYGSSADCPPRVTATEPGREPTFVHVPGEDTWRNVTLGRVEDLTFTSAAGDRIDGRVHYPPDFDPAARYPGIVYYYGGTSPITRDFGGRYPKNLWAAHGYVVYVVNPSGATGYGQQFADRHVNDWGKTSGEEIIAGTRQFLAAHPFVDPERVGCIGASYGGFMTMYLLTRTDMYRAAVAHAGISSISSYWGEGSWGYLYSAVATADSYPWNRPDLYVEQSPLFAADRITTPLLLLHGAADTNVPVGESEQLYTALRVLGREVEFVEFEGENHRIVTYPKRRLWMKTILAWFDRELKDQPEWWHHLYEEEE